MEGGKEKGEETLRNEGNAQRQDHPEEECHFGHEREEVSPTTPTSVSHSSHFLFKMKFSLPHKQGVETLLLMLDINEFIHIDF
jgi:hypothetical protein